MEKLIKQYNDRFSRFALQKEQIRRLWNVNEKSAHILYFFTKAKRPNRILEVGTSNGYSTFWLYLASKDNGTIIDTIEVDKKRYEMARENLQGLSEINLLLGKAEELLPYLEYQYDLVFIDAGKVNYIDYIKLIIPLLKGEALIIADNTLSHEITTRGYNDFVENSELFTSSILPIEDGLTVSIYHEK